MRFFFVNLILTSLLFFAPINQAKAGCGAVLTSTMGTHAHAHKTKEKRKEQAPQKWAARVTTTQETGSTNTSQSEEPSKSK